PREAGALRGRQCREHGERRGQRRSRGLQDLRERGSAREADSTRADGPRVSHSETEGARHGACVRRRQSSEPAQWWNSSGGGKQAGGENENRFFTPRAQRSEITEARLGQKVNP